MAITSTEVDEIVVAIKAEADQYLRALNETESKTKKWATAIGVVIGNFVTSAFRGATSAVTGFLRSSVAAASDAAESLSAFQQVFGDQAEKASEQVEELAKQVGRSAIQIKGQITSQQAFFVGMGFGKEQARELSVQMQALAIDLASFRNLQDEDTINRFRAALSGSSEVLDQFGINIKISALEQEALSQGIEKSVSSMTEQEKVMLRIAVIAKSLGSQGAIGDAERTAGQFANKTRQLSSRMYDLRVEVGEKLLPIMFKFLQTLNSILDIYDQLGWSRPQGTKKSVFKDLFAGLNLDEKSPASQLSTINKEMDRLTKIMSSYQKILSDAEKERVAKSSTALSAGGQEAFFGIERIKDTIALLEKQKQVAQAAADAQREAVLEKNPALARQAEISIRKITFALKEQWEVAKRVGREQDRILQAKLFTSGGQGLLLPFMDMSKGIESFFTSVGKNINDLLDNKSRLVSNTAGQAVFSGTSEAVRLTQIGQTRVSENEKRDKLLEKANTTLSNIFNTVQKGIESLRDAGVDIEVIGVP